MKRRIIVAVVLAVFLAASVYAQTTDFFELVKTATPQDVQTAIDQGADVNAQNGADETVLMYAAEQNHNPEVITTLLKAGADVHASAQGHSALMFAARNNLEVVTTLLKAGAGVNAEDMAGSSVLMYALSAVGPNPVDSNPELITTLLKAGAGANTQADDGGTVLMWAATNPNPEVITTLLKAGAGANVNTQDDNGETALIKAARKQTPEVIATLLKAGADATVKNSEGKTALDYANDNDTLKGTDAYQRLEEASKLIHPTRGVLNDSQVRVRGSLRTGSIAVPAGASRRELNGGSYSASFGTRRGPG